MTRSDPMPDENGPELVAWLKRNGTPVEGLPDGQYVLSLSPASVAFLAGLCYGQAFDSCTDTPR